jgi:hypothetical protein
MAENDQPLFTELREELGRLGADLREMAALRWQLARLELAADLRTLKRLAVLLVVAGAMTLAALPVLACWAAELLAGRLHVGRAGWLLIFGLGLLLGGAAVGYLAQRWFRSRFTGLEQTREELSEDLVWLGEWRKGQRD